MNKIKYSVITALAVIHQIITHRLCKNIFTVPPSENISDYVICTICAFVAGWFFYLALWQVIIDKNRKNNTITRIIRKAFPYLIVMLAVTLIKLRSGYLSNDETLIYENAVSLTHYTWFYYITTYYYIVSLMLIPHMYAPIFVKLIIEYLVVGYTLLRSGDYFDTRTDEPFISLGKRGQTKIGYGMLTIFLFLLYPVIAYTTSAHRLPIYFLLYLFMMVMLLFDRLEQSVLTLRRLAALLVLGAVLTQWRTEGIYLLVLIPILMFITYSTVSIPRITLRDVEHGDNKQPLISVTGNCVFNIKKRTVMITILIAYLFIQYLISIPQNGIAARELGAAADDRMKPFYAYTITNMYRNGLDMDKNAEDLAIVDKYISLDSLDAINDYYGNINYEDVLILYQPGFVGVREDADVTEYYNFVAALKRIFKNNPQIFLRTRIGAFVYAALPYHITYTGNDPRSLISLAVSIVKSVSYNLFIPLIIVLFILIYALTESRWFTFFVSGGLLAHWFIVFILAPASYFKYYFPVYITAYLYLLLIIIAGVHNRKHRTKIKILQ